MEKLQNYPKRRNQFICVNAWRVKMNTPTFNTDGNKVFFDISGLINYIKKVDRYSGIQRVMVELITEFTKLSDPKLIYLSWCEPRSGTQRCVLLEEIGRDTLASPAKLRQLFHPRKAARSNLPVLDRYRRSPVKYYYHRTRLDVMSLLRSEAPFRKKDMTSKMWRAVRWGKAPKSTSGSRRTEQALFEVAAKGDHLVLLDSSWQAHQSQGFKMAKEHGMEVHTLVYDLIPIEAPQLTAGSMPYIFYDWLLTSREYTSRYMTISEATRRDLLRFFQAHDIQHTATTVPLAQAGLSKTEPAENEVHQQGPVSSRISFDAYPQLEDARHLNAHLRKIVGEPYALCVGTVELRKNIWRTAMAWKYLVDQGHTDLPKLIFAGRRGWVTTEFDLLMKGTGDVYGYVSEVKGPTDEELHVLYKNCQFVLMPSVYEGWGLPVGEALAYGKSAVVAENSSLVEVGMDLVEYCDAMSVKSIAEAVLRLNDPSHRATLEDKIKVADLRSWSDVAQDMGQAMYAPR
ncbi:glycosyltransferase [Ruegeria sp. HKCCD6228]|uniref:glycosyltransferase n=2 Tax=Ruegeria TaxID=97050 RepID=UPI001489A0B1|nr:MULTISPECIES: glycosyltransferase [unclassified Ruegeria]NOD99520.1 glycosyltransferase [Ruegeria sp. HKCCD6228]